MVQTLEEQATETAQSLDDLTLCYQLHVKMPGMRRKADKSQVDFQGADEEMFGLSKTIVDSDEYRAVTRHVRYMKSFVRSIALPSPLMKGGFYQINVERIKHVTDKVNDEMIPRFNELVDDFIEAYGGISGTGEPLGLVAKAKEHLGPQFKLTDYPSRAELKSAFDVTTQFIETRVPSKLRKVSIAVYEHEQEKAKETWTSLQATYVQLLRSEFKELVDKMVGMLGTTEDGKKKKFISSNVSKLREFLQEAPYKNVAKDEELPKLIGVATKLLDGADPEVVKSDEDYRDKLHESFEMLSDKLSTLVDDKPRMISFDDEEV
jgi:hypothetical protein